MISAAKIVIFSIENNILCNFLSKNIPFVYRMIEKRLATFWLQAFNLGWHHLLGCQRTEQSSGLGHEQ